MMKWLRTHSKKIMAGLVLLAMFSFVGGSALVSIVRPDPLKDPFATAFGQEIVQGEIVHAQRQIDVLNRIFAPQYPDAARRQFGEIWQFGNPRLRSEHWYLLAREAEEAGIQVPESVIDRQTAQLSANFIETLRTRDRISVQDIREALARFLSIGEYANRVLSCAAPSEPEIRHLVAETQNKVRVKYVSIPAQRYVDPDEPLTEEEIVAHFEANKALDPNESETGYGYRYPRRVRVQYIVASIPKIAPQMEVSFESVKAYWKANKAQFTRVEYVEPTATTQPTDSQPAPQPKTVQKSFSEARDDVESELRLQSARQVGEQAIRKAHSMLLRPWLDVRVDPETGYKPIPPGGDDPKAMQQIAERLEREFNIPLDYGETELLPTAVLRNHADLRGAFLYKGGPEMQLPEYAMRVPPFYQPTPEESLPCLQFFQPCEAPFIAQDTRFTPSGPVQTIGRYVVFRVIEAAESAPPESLDEVREQVENDVHVVKAFDRAESDATEFYAAAIRLGTESALELFDELKSRRSAVLLSPPPFPRRSWRPSPPEDDPNALPLGPPNVTGLGASERFVDACFDMADPGWSPPQMSLPTTERTDLATTRPAKEPPPRVRLLGLPKLKRWTIIEFLGEDRVDTDQYANRLREAVASQIQRFRGGALREAWFDVQHIEARCGFEKITEALSPSDGAVSPTNQPPPIIY